MSYGVPRLPLESLRLLCFLRTNNLTFRPDGEPLRFVVDGDKFERERQCTHQQKPSAMLKHFTGS